MYKYFFILFLILPVVLKGQVKSIGTPQIQNYLKSEYNAGTQNWAITQDKEGFMYFANNDGVLRFDGMQWELFPVSVSSPIRCVFSDSKDRIFVGLFNDFGILEQKEHGLPRYVSLKNLLPNPEMDFDNIWKIHEIPQGIVFQSFDFLFIYKEEEIEVIQPNRRYHFSFNINGRLFLNEPGVGLFEYINGFISRVPWAGELADNEIWTILSIQDNNLLIGTNQSGIYKFENGILEKWDTPANEFIEKYKLFSATKLTDNYFAFGTITNGVVIADAKGEIIQTISRTQGLQNNTVLSLFDDDSGNLWLGLDNGIDYIEINSPITYISDYEELGTGYAARIFNDKLYIGTNQGLFVKPFNEFSRNEEKFQFVENTTGQVWSLNIFDNQLICGHHNGIYTINGTNAIQIAQEEGAWNFIRLKQNSDFLLGGHYTGLQLLSMSGGQWKFYANVKGFNESSRYLVQDENQIIWMSHGGKGIFKIILSNELDSVSEYKLYTSKDGLPSDLQNIIFDFKGKAYVAAINGIYEYQTESDSFIISNELNNLFSFESRLKTLKTDIEGNIWFITENESGVFRINEDLTYTKITSPFKQLDNKYVNEFEFIYPYNNENVFLAIDNGFAHYSSKFPKSYSETFKSFITHVEIPYLDSVIWKGELKSDFLHSFPFPKNSFRFYYTAPFYENQDQLMFSFLLENYSDGWSEWSANNYKDFTNLREGEYKFSVKALNLYGNESIVSEFDFEIEPPWYRTITAYYIYVFFFLLLIGLTVRFVLHRLEVAKNRQKRKYQEELEKKDELFQHQALVTEKEIIKLRNEKLHSEMIHRDKELANQTMGIIQKNKFLMKLKSELQRMQKSTKDGEFKTKLAMLNRRINKEIDNKQQNQLFELYFDEVHEDFFDRLKNKHPELSPREMRLCAYIKMNLTSKEISVMLNITDRGVEIGRYRLRKKLNISRKTNLSTYLSNI